MASLGQSLREKREARNISIEEIAAATKIVPRYLEALEADRLDKMPGGFFIKGIIRTYARAIGLDANEVLGWYKAAGLLAGPDRGQDAFPKPAPAAVPPPASAPVVMPVPPVPAEPTLPFEPASPPAPLAAPDLAFEEAPKPRLSPAARKRIVAWAWRITVAVLVLIVLIVIWSSRRPRPPRAQPSTVATQEVLPPAQKTGPGSAPASPAQSEPASRAASEPAVKPAPKPEAPAVVEEVWKGVTIEISFQAETWIQVHTDGDLQVDGLFPAGAIARAQADKELLIQTGNAGGFTFRLNGKPAKALGRSGQFLTNVKITPENYKDFLEGPSSGQPGG